MGRRAAGRHRLRGVEERGWPGRTTSPTALPRPTRPTRCACWPRSWAPRRAGQRREPRRGGAGLGDLRGRLGRGAGAVYGVSREELFYAGRTVLGHEVLPEHVAAAVFALRGWRSPPAPSCRWTAGCRWRSYGEGRRTHDDDRPRPHRRGERDPPRLAQSDLAHALDVVGRTGVDGEAVVAEVARFSAAAPSWAVGTGGTRFGRFPGGGEPATRSRRSTTSPRCTRSTGANRSVSLHVPWDDPGLGAAPPTCAATPGSGHRLRRHELQHVPGQPLDHPRRGGLLQVRQPGQRTTAPGGRRSSTTTT